MKQAQCLGTLLFHESRGEGITGRLGVASVALQRASRAIPKYGSLDICAIMKEDRQFSWYRKHPRVLTIDELGDMLYEAHLILEQYSAGTFIDVTGGATHFATKGTHNYWTRKFRHTVTIGNLKFYKDKK